MIQLLIYLILAGLAIPAFLLCLNLVVEILELLFAIWIRIAEGMFK